MLPTTTSAAVNSIRLFGEGRALSMMRRQPLRAQPGRVPSSSSPGSTKRRFP